MSIFDEIFEQSMQLASINKQYKRNLQLLSIGNNVPLAKKSDNVGTIITSKEYNKNSKSNSVVYRENSIGIKELYDKMEFDARRYNRNLDAQTGVI